MSTATYAGFVLPEDVVHVGNVDAQKGICQLLGRQVEEVVEEWPKLQILLVGVEDIDPDNIDEEVLSKYLGLAERALTEASEAARQSFLRGSGDAASFDKGVPLHTELIVAAAEKLAAGFTDCDPRILQKVMCIQRMNYLLDLRPPEGERVVCPVCHKVLPQKEAVTHAMRFGPCRTGLLHGALPLNKQFPCRGCQDINCKRGEFPFLDEFERDRHEMRHRLVYVCKGATGGQDEGCGCSGCSETFNNIGSLRRHIKEASRKVSDKDEYRGRTFSSFIGVFKAGRNRYRVRYTDRQGKEVIVESWYDNEVNAALEYNRLVIQAGLRDIRPVNPIFDGVPQAKILCVDEVYDKHLYRTVRRKCSPLYTPKKESSKALTPEEYAVALKGMLLPIEVYWPSDQKWHRGRKIDKLPRVRQYKVEYDDGGGTRWEALVEQYDGDGVPPCRGDEDHSYWRFAEASTSAPEASTSARVVTDLAVGDKLRKFFEGFGWATGRVEIIEDGRVEVHWFEDETYQEITVTEALAHRVSRDAPDSDSEDEMPVSQLLARQAE